MTRLMHNPAVSLSSLDGVRSRPGLSTWWTLSDGTAADLGPRRALFLDPRKLDLLPTVQQRRRVALQRSGYLEPVEIRKQPANRHAHLLTGEVRAQTEVDAVSECQVLTRGPGDQEAVGVIEAARISVGRRHVQRDDRAR